MTAGCITCEFALADSAHNVEIRLLVPGGGWEMYMEAVRIFYQD